MPIEERAIEYCKEQWDEPTAMTAYMDGAAEQKAIDDAILLKLKSAWEKQAQINHDDEANYQQGYTMLLKKPKLLLAKPAGGSLPIFGIMQWLRNL